jgi:hypothetical protein
MKVLNYPDSFLNRDLILGSINNKDFLFISTLLAQFLWESYITLRKKNNNIYIEIRVLDVNILLGLLV